MADFVRYELADGGQVYFEASEGSLVSLRGGGEPDIVDGGRLGQRLLEIAATAGSVASSLRGKLQPDEIKLEFGVKVAGEMNWWFFAKNSGEGNIAVTLTWQGPVDGTLGVSVQDTRVGEDGSPGSAK